MAYITGAALYQFLGILCGLVSILLESYAYHTDERWNRRVEDYERSNRGGQDIKDKVAGLCKAIEKDAYIGQKKEPGGARANKGLFFPSSILNQLEDRHLKRDQFAEKTFLALNGIITLVSSIHLTLCCITNKIIYRTKYNAMVHGCAIALLLLGAALLTTSRFTIDDSFVKIAKSTTECDQFIACIEEEETEAHELYFKLQKENGSTIIEPSTKFKNIACQQSNLKDAASIVNLIYTFLCGCVLCSAMNVVIQYGDEEFVLETHQDETDLATNQRLSFGYEPENQMFAFENENQLAAPSMMTLMTIKPPIGRASMKALKPPIIPTTTPPLIAARKSRSNQLKKSMSSFIA